MGEKHQRNILNNIFEKKDKNREEEILEIIKDHFSELIKNKNLRLEGSVICQRGKIRKKTHVWILYSEI